MQSKPGLGLAGWIVIGVVLMLGALVSGSLYAPFDHVYYADMVIVLQTTSRSHLLLAVLTMGLSYIALAGYGASGLRYVGAHVAPIMIAITSFIAYTLGNTIDLGLLIVGVVRARLHTTAGVDVARVTEAVAFNVGVLGVPTTVFDAVGLPWGVSHIAAITYLPVTLLEMVALLILVGVVALLLLCMRQRHVMPFGRQEIHLLPPGLVAR